MAATRWVPWSAPGASLGKNRHFMNEDGVTRRFWTASHWGAYQVDVADSVVVRTIPFAGDSAPPHLLDSLRHAVNDPTRIARPAIRRGWLRHGPSDQERRRFEDDFVAVPWDEALDLVAQDLDRVRRDHGNAAIFAGSGWGSAGRFHQAGGQLYRFMDGLGGVTRQINNYSYGAGMVILPHVVGSMQPVTGPISSFDGMIGRTGLFVAFGGLAAKNFQIDSGGLADHAALSWFRRLRDAGTSFVLVGPSAADMPDDLPAEWLAIRPDTDTALALALTREIIAADRHDREFLARYCVGFETLSAYLAGEEDGQERDADWAAPICGIPADAIRNLAAAMVEHRTMVSGSWSIQRHEHGEQTYWAIIALAAVIGQIGLPGGGFGFGYGSTGGSGVPRRVLSPHPSVGATRRAGASFIPAGRLTDMLLHPGATYPYNGTELTYPDIRLMYWAGGNPFHHHQDLNRMVAAWRRVQTIIVNNSWWTANAKFADIVLPATTTLERMDIALSARDRFIVKMEAALPTYGQARSDFAIFSGLAERLGFGPMFSQSLDEAGWVRRTYDEIRQQAAALDVALPEFAQFWGDGMIAVAPPDQPYTLFEAFRTDPDAHPLDTQSGRIELSSATIAGFGYADCPPHPAWIEPTEWSAAAARHFPLYLVTNQPATRLHGQLDSGAISQQGKIDGREPIRIHPDDAAARSINDGDTVRVFNDRGAILAAALVTTTLKQGVVSMPTGAWYDPVIAGAEVGLDRRGNPNALTLDRGTSSLAQAPSSGTCCVEIERVTHAAPPSAYAPPQIDDV